MGNDFGIDWNGDGVINGADVAIDLNGSGNASKQAGQGTFSGASASGSTSSNDPNGLGQSKYDFNNRTFPLDLGATSSYTGHYMTININVQNQSRLSKVDNQNVFTVLPNDFSKTDVLRYQLDGLHTNQDGDSLIQPFLNNGITSNLGIRRQTKRIVESIALYMPNSELTFTDQHEFQNISLTKFVTGAAMQIASAIPIADEVAGVLGAVGSTAATGSQLAQMPVNPKVEVLFANTFQRQFSFDFLFAPSSEAESKVLQEIIRTLRFHAAPEYRTGNQQAGNPLGLASSFFWIPPSEFDITFYNRGIENTAIPRINTCVLEQIDVSYSPTGTYATFANGYPVQIRMVLRFRETEVNSKQRLLYGF